MFVGIGVVPPVGGLPPEDGGVLVGGTTAPLGVSSSSITTSIFVYLSTVTSIVASSLFNSTSASLPSPVIEALAFMIVLSTTVSRDNSIVARSSTINSLKSPSSMSRTLETTIIIVSIKSPSKCN